MTETTDTSGYAKEPHVPYDPAKSAQRRAGFERAHRTNRDEPQRWNGVDRP